MSRRLLPAILALTLLLAACGSSSKKSTTVAPNATTPVSAATSATTPATSSATTVATTGSATTAATSAATTSASTTPATSAQEIGFEKVPIEQGSLIAPASTTQTGIVDNLIKCGSTEQLAYHIHAHFAVYVDGAPRALPGGIGIPGSKVESYPGYGPVATGGTCIYWLHTHAPDGVIHVESPTARIYTLGQFFDEWHQPLTPTQIGTIQGKATWYVDGKVWTKNPRLIPLLPQIDIQANVGEPAVAFHATDWRATQLWVGSPVEPTTCAVFKPKSCKS